MKGFMVFTKKELQEQLRTYRSFILLSAFFLLGMLSPLTARLLPEIVSQIDMNGIKIILPEPGVMDAYAQFFKNITQMGLLAVLLVFGGTLSNELVTGTLINLLSKGLPRRTVLLSKYVAAVLLWTVSYLVAAAVNYLYTQYLFAGERIEHLGFALFCLWLFGCFLIALVILSSTVAAGTFGGLILSVLSIAVMLMLQLFPNTERYNPVTLASRNAALLSGEAAIGDMAGSVAVTVCLLTGSLLLSIVLFHRKKL